MKLTYKILWFEDQFRNIEPMISRLEGHIRRNGFVPEIERKTGISEDEIDELSDSLNEYNPYDIIIFDYDLGADSENGLSIAAKLRSSIFTDLIFYSGKVAKDLREMLYIEKVDGVFIVDRRTFYDDVVPIVDDHIKRMSDINNIRGVAMSAMSGADNLMRNILLGLVNKLDDNKSSELLADVKRRLQSKVDRQSSKINSIAEVGEAISDHFLTDFDSVRIALKSLYDADDNGHRYLNEESLLVSMQRERNKLAHQRDEYTDDGKLILHGRNGERKEYNFTEFKRIRSELVSINAQLNDL